MTNPDYTALLLILDRSGSMQTIRADAEGAVNAFILDQAGQPGQCTVRVVHFDHDYEVVHGSVDIADVPVFHLVPQGNTALYDAIGRGIIEFGTELAAMSEDARPGKVLVVVQTDGLENSSREFTSAGVKRLIETQRTLYSWDFVFLGANQDAVLTGTNMGFATGSSLTFDATSAGVQAAAASVSSYASTYRGGGAASFSTTDRKAAVRSEDS